MNGTGYDAINKVAASEFTKEQRRRLEAVTAAKGLFGHTTVTAVLDVAEFIASGVRDR